jgi:hypothetical protein
MNHDLSLDLPLRVRLPANPLFLPYKGGYTTGFL